MMRPQNVLFGHLPETVTVSGKEFPINTDFRTWLIAGEILKSNVAPERKAAKLIRLCYKDKRPSSIGHAISAIIDFYKGAFPRYKNSGSKASFCPDFDGCVIYSGFYKTFGIDLSSENMHWYRFAPLLSELSDCLFAKILEYRRSDISKINKTARGFYARMKRNFELPSDNLQGNFAQSLWNAF